MSILHLKKWTRGKTLEDHYRCYCRWQWTDWLTDKLFLVLSLVGESHGYVHVPCHLVGNELREAYNLSSVPLGTSIRHVPVCQPSFEGQERRVRAIDLFAT